MNLPDSTREGTPGPTETRPDSMGLETIPMNFFVENGVLWFKESVAGAVRHSRGR